MGIDTIRISENIQELLNDLQKFEIILLFIRHRKKGNNSYSMFISDEEPKYPDLLPDSNVWTQHLFLYHSIILAYRRIYSNFIYAFHYIHNANHYIILILKQCRGHLSVSIG